MQLPKVSEETKRSILGRLADTPDSMGAPLRDQVITENAILAGLLFHFADDIPEPGLALMAAWLTYEAFVMEFRAKGIHMPTVTTEIARRALARWTLPKEDFGNPAKMAEIRGGARDLVRERKRTNPNLVEVIKAVADIHPVPQGPMWLAVLVYCCLQEACREPS